MTAVDSPGSRAYDEEPIPTRVRISTEPLPTDAAGAPAARATTSTAVRPAVFDIRDMSVYYGANEALTGRR